MCAYSRMKQKYKIREENGEKDNDGMLIIYMRIYGIYISDCMYLVYGYKP